MDKHIETGICPLCRQEMPFAEILVLFLAQALGPEKTKTAFKGWLEDGRFKIPKQNDNSATFAEANANPEEFKVTSDEFLRFSMAGFSNDRLSRIFYALQEMEPQIQALNDRDDVSAEEAYQQFLELMQRSQGTPPENWHGLFQEIILTLSERLAAAN